MYLGGIAANVLHKLLLQDGQRLRGDGVELSRRSLHQVSTSLQQNKGRREKGRRRWSSSSEGRHKAWADRRKRERERESEIGCKGCRARVSLGGTCVHYLVLQGHLLVRAGDVPDLVAPQHGGAQLRVARGGVLCHQGLKEGLQLQPFLHTKGYGEHREG